MFKTSIIVPVYNTAEYLKDCFDSIYSQTQKELEVIAVNDGSTDESLPILEEIKKEHPEMVIFSQENKGLGSARNKGIELAKGEYIYFLDSDDCLVSTAMEKCYQFAHLNNLDIVMFDAVEFGDVSPEKKESFDRSKIIKEREEVLSGEDFANKYWRSSYSPTVWLMYISAGFLHKHQFRFMDKIYYEDNEFYCKLIASAMRTMYIPHMLYKRRCRKASITSSVFDGRHANDFLQMIQAVNKQSYSQGMLDIMHDMKLNFLQTLLIKCRNNKLLADTELLKRFYKVVQDICGDSVEDITDYKDIKILRDISETVGNKVISEGELSKIQIKERSLLRNILNEIPLIYENKYVGIYGMGNVCNEFIEAYRKEIGNICAKLFFIDSNIKTGESKYLGYEVVNVNDIAGLELDCIVVASLKYEEEMRSNIIQRYGKKFKIFCLGIGFHYCI